MDASGTPEFIGIAEAAKAIGVSRATIKNYARQRDDFPHLYVIAGRKALKFEEFRAWIESQKVPKGTLASDPRARNLPNRRRPKVTANEAGVQK